MANFRLTYLFMFEEKNKDVGQHMGLFKLTKYYC